MSPYLWGGGAAAGPSARLPPALVLRGRGHGGDAEAGSQRAESAAKVATQASAEFQLIAISLVEYE